VTDNVLETVLVGETVSDFDDNCDLVAAVNVSVLEVVTDRLVVTVEEVLLVRLFTEVFVTLDDEEKDTVSVGDLVVVTSVVNEAVAERVGESSVAVGERDGVRD
jgi:hypothetical protein